MEHASFRDEVLNWDLELGYSGNPYTDGKYTLRINKHSVSRMHELGIENN